MLCKYYTLSNIYIYIYIYIVNYILFILMLRVLKTMSVLLLITFIFKNKFDTYFNN